MHPFVAWSAEGHDVVERVGLVVGRSSGEDLLHRLSVVAIEHVAGIASATLVEVTVLHSITDLSPMESLDSGASALLADRMADLDVGWASPLVDAGKCSAFIAGAHGWVLSGRKASEMRVTRIWWDDG
jgi:hypothetical protein